MLWPRGRDLWPWDPFREVRHIQHEMDRLLAGLWPGVAPARVFPTVNVWTGRDDVVVTAELPGVDPKDLELSVVGDTLTIGGSRQTEMKEGQVINRQEREAGNFARTIQLPFRVQPDKVEARYARGVLQITLPRLEADKPKQIAVKATN